MLLFSFPILQRQFNDDGEISFFPSSLKQHAMNKWKYSQMPNNLHRSSYTTELISHSIHTEWTNCVQILRRQPIGINPSTCWLFYITMKLIKMKEKWNIGRLKIPCIANVSVQFGFREICHHQRNHHVHCFPTNAFGLNSWSFSHIW